MRLVGGLATADIRRRKSPRRERQPNPAPLNLSTTPRDSERHLRHPFSGTGHLQPTATKLVQRCLRLADCRNRGTSPSAENIGSKRDPEVLTCDPKTGFWFNSFTRKGINEAAIRKTPIKDIESWVHSTILIGGRYDLMTSPAVTGSASLFASSRPARARVR
jgi:hypothetical protein